MALKAIAAQVPKVTKEALKRRGPAFATIVAEWGEIVGPALAGSCLPEKLSTPPRPPKGGTAPPSAGTLTIRVSGGAAMELQHLAPLLLERINRFAGFKAVERLRFVQGPMPERQILSAPAPVPLSDAQKTSIAAAIESVAAPELQAALARLGAGLVGKRRGKAQISR
jgi:hypothetical protein